MVVSMDPPLSQAPVDDLCNIGAFIIRIGLGAHYTTVIIRNPQNSIGNLVLSASTPSLECS